MKLLPFRRLLERADSPPELLGTLVELAVDELTATGAAVVEVFTTGVAKLVASRNLPPALTSWSADLDTIDGELGTRLLELAGGRFTQAHTFPMRSGTDLFGALVLFYDQPVSIEGGRLMMAESLADLAAISLSKAFQYDELARSYAALRASRQSLERGEKLRALGEMAAGISHDLKNILNPLSLYLQLMKRSIRRGEDVSDAIGEMEQVLRRGVDTVERLREFSRQAPEKAAELVDIAKLVHEAAQIARPRLAKAAPGKRGVELVERLDATPPVMLRSSEFVNAIVNLVANAIDALAEGGTVEVATATIDGRACITVKDDGPGIPEDIQHRIFEPFFTTKGKEGTGLGLAMVWAFVRRHGGTINLDSAPDRGTTFALSFPAAAAD